MDRKESPSSISTYIKCPRRYQYIYVDNYQRGGGIYSEIGKSFHSVMEHFYDIFYDNNSNLAPKTAMQEAIVKYWNPEIGSMFQAESIKMFDNYLSYLLNNDNLQKPLFCEKEIIGMYVTRIDRIDKDKIVDYKTSSKFVKKPDVFNRIQAVLYYLNLKDVLGITIPQVEFHYVRHMNNSDKGIQKLKITNELIAEVIEIVDTVKFNTLNNYYPKSNKECFFCDYSKVCDVIEHSIVSCK